MELHVGVLVNVLSTIDLEVMSVLIALADVTVDDISSRNSPNASLDMCLGSIIHQTHRQSRAVHPVDHTIDGCTALDTDSYSSIP